MFLHLSMILFTGGGGVCPTAWWADTPGQTPPPQSTNPHPGTDTPTPGQTPPGRHPPRQTPPQADTPHTPSGRLPLGQNIPPPIPDTTRCSPQAGGTHPNGMHTCIFMELFRQILNVANHFLCSLDDNRIDFHDAKQLAQIVQSYSVAPHRPFVLCSSNELKARLFYAVGFKMGLKLRAVEQLDCHVSPPVPVHENEIAVWFFPTDVCTTQLNGEELLVTTSSEGVLIIGRKTKQVDFKNTIKSRSITADRKGNVFVIDHSDECIHRFNLNAQFRYVGILLKGGDDVLGKPVMIRWCNSVSSLVVAHVINETIYISMVHVD